MPFNFASSNGPSWVWTMRPARSMMTVKGSAPTRLPRVSRQLDGAEAADDSRIVRAGLRNELAHLVGLVRRDADELQALRTELLLRDREERHLFAARRAPGRPEIDDEHLATPLRERLLLPVLIGKGQPEDRIRIALARREIRRMQRPVAEIETRAQGSDRDDAGQRPENPAAFVIASADCADVGAYSRRSVRHGGVSTVPCSVEPGLLARGGFDQAARPAAGHRQRQRH